jgi:biotin carboxyl carrier protein
MEDLKVNIDGKVYEVSSSLAKEQQDYELSDVSSEQKAGDIKANLPGIIFSLEVKEGQKVKKGQKLVSLVAMKMENQILSPMEGTVKKVAVKKNDKVNKGDLLLVIE